MVEIIDDFLEPYQFKSLQSTMMTQAFPWFWNDQIVLSSNPDHSDRHYQFTHSFYDHQVEGYNEYFGLIEPFLHKFNIGYLSRVKANLNPRTLFHVKGGYHIDFTDDPPLTTAILYINTNNGSTIIKGYGRVKCVANRLVRFPSNMEHTGISCTDQKRKIVINFNYEQPR
tara:strand:+ start:144 stop:653 length:510 start_codon:yes stop_codon:yes gene_type:complete